MPWVRRFVWLNSEAVGLDQRYRKSMIILGANI